MVKKVTCMLPIVLCLIFACESKVTPWKPVFEDTSFRYLENSVNVALKSLQEAENSLNENRPAQETAAALAEVRHVCLVLQDYYIPLTEVRQQIYDADRFFYLKGTEKAKSRLEDSRKMVEKMNQFAEGGGFHSALIELTAMIDECILSIDEKETTVAYDKFKNLGHKVNLMLIKGGLIISEMKFL